MIRKQSILSRSAASLAFVLIIAVFGQPIPAADPAPVPIPPGTPVTITVVPASTPSPPASIVLGSRHGHVTPQRSGFTHTGGGNIDVAQPTSDVVVITMTGVAVAGAHPFSDSIAGMNFDLTQNFEISFDNPKLKRAKLVLEGRVIGLLRSHAKGGGTAGEGPGMRERAPRRPVARHPVRARTRRRLRRKSVAQRSRGSGRDPHRAWQVHDWLKPLSSRRPTRARCAPARRPPPNSPPTRPSIRYGSATGNRSTARTKKISVSRSP